jgi:hypothetical protein
MNERTPQGYTTNRGGLVGTQHDENLEENASSVQRPNMRMEGDKLRNRQESEECFEFLSSQTKQELKDKPRDRHRFDNRRSRLQTAVWT